MNARLIKRILDFTLSSIALILLSPLLVIVALYVRMRIGSPVFFIQQRPGLNGQIFNMYKFRTMSDTKDETGALLPDSMRITKTGAFLRKTSIDELPELFNIAKGDMSLVGPRPLLPEYINYYTASEMERHNMRPGLTGLAQVAGRNNLAWDRRLALDVEYVRQWSLSLDFLIMARTIKQLFKFTDVIVVPSTKFKKLSEERQEKKNSDV